MGHLARDQLPEGDIPLREFHERGLSASQQQSSDISLSSCELLYLYFIKYKVGATRNRWSRAQGWGWGLGGWALGCPKLVSLKSLISTIYIHSLPKCCKME